MSPLLIPVILQGLQTALPMVAQLFAGTDPKRQATAQVASAVVDTVVRATGAVNAQAALEKVQTDERAREAAEEAIKREYYALQSLAQLDREQWEREEKSRQDARAFSLSVLSMDGWRAVGFGVLLGFLALVILLGGGLVLREVMMDTWADVQTKAGIVEAMKAIVILVVGYFFGSSSDSRRKTEMLREHDR